MRTDSPEPIPSLKTDRAIKYRAGSVKKRRPQTVEWIFTQENLTLRIPVSAPFLK